MPKFKFGSKIKFVNIAKIKFWSKIKLCKNLKPWLWEVTICSHCLFYYGEKDEQKMSQLKYYTKQILSCLEGAMFWQFNLTDKHTKIHSNRLSQVSTGACPAPFQVCKDSPHGRPLITYSRFKENQQLNN